MIATAIATSRKIDDPCSDDENQSHELKRRKKPTKARKTTTVHWQT